MDKIFAPDGQSGNRIKNNYNSQRINIQSNGQEKSAVSAAGGGRDSAAISGDWQTKTDWQMETQQLIDNLRQSFPKIGILFSDNLSRTDLSRLAAALGEGSHLILSEDFLEKMSSGKDGFEAGKKALIDALQSLSRQPAKIGKGAYLSGGKSLYWNLSVPEEIPEETKPDWQQEAERITSMLERMKEMQQQQKDAKKKQKDFRKQTSAEDYQSAGSYARLASAGSKAQVQWVMSETRRKISNLRMAAALGDSEDKAKAQAAIRAHQTLLMRGGRKIRRLTEEELTQARKRRAEKNEEYEKALHLKIELNKQRSKRKTADYMIAEEGKLYDLNHGVFSSRKRHSYSPADAASPAGTIPAAPPESPAVPTPPAAEPGAAAPGAAGSFQVTFSESPPQ